MWKETYKIGIEAIDRQHMELFRMVESLLKAIKAGAGKEKYEMAIRFMKDYVVKHFAAEEAYQESVGYPGIEGHKKLHRACTEAVLNYEKKLTETDYDIKVVKDFAGMLTAWLIYHVANEDQKIAGKKTDSGRYAGESYVESFSGSVKDVLNKMTGADAGSVTEQKIPESSLEGDIYVVIGLTGDIKGKAVYAYSRDFAFGVVKSMTMMEPTQVDELVCSALSEISNIISGNAATDLSSRGIACDIRTPVIYLERDSKGSGEGQAMLVRTGMGDLKIAVELE